MEHPVSASLLWRTLCYRHIFRRQSCCGGRSLASLFCSSVPSTPAILFCLGIVGETVRELHCPQEVCLHVELRTEVVEGLPNCGCWRNWRCLRSSLQRHPGKVRESEGSCLGVEKAFYPSGRLLLLVHVCSQPVLCSPMSLETSISAKTTVLKLSWFIILVKNTCFVVFRTILFVFAQKLFTSQSCCFHSFGNFRICCTSWRWYAVLSIWYWRCGSPPKKTTDFVINSSYVWHWWLIWHCETKTPWIWCMLRVSIEKELR